MKIVVANSVGIDARGYRIVHVPSRWSLGVKNFTNCGYYPWELAYTSSLLKRETNYKVKMFDGVLNGWGFAKYLERIAEEEPDWLVMESSSRTIDEDLRLASAISKKFGTRLIFAGQHAMANPDEVLRTAHHVCVGEYEFAVLDLIRGRSPKTIAGVYPNQRGELPDINALPFPEDDDVSRLDYHEPNCRYRQIQMYASRGCPRRCNFCAAATLYYDKLNWRPRHVTSVVSEIATLFTKYPEMEGIFFDEEVHNIKRQFNLDLADAIRAEGLDRLKYEAMCEYASLDVEVMRQMARAGYYKIRMGIETASDIVAQKMTLGKKYDLKKLRHMLERGKEFGLIFYGTISVGGLGSNEKEDGKTIDLIQELSAKGLLDEIQVSVNTPQPGTDFFNTAIKEGFLRPNLEWTDYDGNGQVVVEYPNYSADQIRKKFNEALAVFDKGRETARTEIFQQTARESFSFIPKGARVLIMRSARIWMIHLILNSLVEQRHIKADLLGQDVIELEFRNRTEVDQFYSYGSGFFSVDNFSSSLVRALRDRDYDIIVTPFANNNLAGYQNVLDSAQLIQPRKILGVYPDGATRELVFQPTTV
tara:strand:- start:49 stop:1815 length:1767 start_codon:yes stop_codon:yes gene_type:complete